MSVQSLLIHEEAQLNHAVFSSARPFNWTTVLPVYRDVRRTNLLNKNADSVMIGSNLVDLL